MKHYALVLAICGFAFAASAGDLYVGAGEAYATIQDAVDAAGSGDVIHVAAGVYDVGGRGQGSEDTSNRVVIASKSNLTIVGAGRGKTIVRGSRTAGEGSGTTGSANMVADGKAWRCFRVYNSRGIVVSDMTLECGEVKCVNMGSGDNGGAVYVSGNSAVTFVDCDMSTCAAPTGGLVSGGTYVRCRLEAGHGGYSAAADSATLINCSVSRSVTDRSGSGVLRACTLYNCTIADNRGAYALSGSSKAYNCLILLSGDALTDGGAVELTDCVTDDTAAHGFMQVMAPTIGDFSPLPGSDALGAGTYANLSGLSLPEGVSQYVDLDGQPIVADGSGKVTAGCVQAAGVPAAGGLYLTWRVNRNIDNEKSYIVVNGKQTKNSEFSTWVYPTNYPMQYKVSAIPKNGSYYLMRWHRPQDSSYLYAATDGSAWLTPPPGTSAVCTNAAEVGGDRIWVDEKLGNDSTGALNNESKPYKTIQAAVTAASVSYNRLILVKPGWYTNGVTTVDGAQYRIASESDKLLIRAVGGPDVTFIGGARAPLEDQDDPTTYPGSGSGAVAACSFKTRAGSAMQGFTFVDCCASAENKPIAAAAGSYFVDCVFSNCVGRFYGVQANCKRCRFVDNVSARDTVSGTASSCYFRGNTTVGSSYGAAAGTAVFCTIVGDVKSGNLSSNVKSFNSIWDGGTSIQSTWTPFGSIFWNYVSSSVSESSFISKDPMFVSRATSPELYAASPAVAAGVYPTVENTASVKWYLYCGTDIEGEPIAWGAGGKPTIGAYPLATNRCVFIEQPANGGIALEGASFGASPLSESTAFTVLPAACTRPCIGVLVGGEFRPFTNYWSEANGRYEIPVTAADAVGGDIVVEAVYSTDWYADDDGSDSNSGALPKLAKKTLAIAEAAMANGDTLHVLPGIYDEGDSTALNAGLRSRIVVNCNHTVVSTDGPENTIIVGAPANEPDAYGNGEDAIRCASVCKNAKLSGFTLTGGHVNAANAWNCQGGGVKGETGSGSLDPDGISLVDNCIISNCTAKHGAAVANCCVARSVIVGNTATSEGSGAYGAKLYGCYLDYGKGDYVIGHSTDVIGCTVGANSVSLAGKSTASLSAHNDGSRLINSLFLLPLSLHLANGCQVRNCAYPSTSNMSGSGVVVDAATCISTNVEALAVLDGVPVVGQNAAIDRGDPTAFDDVRGLLDPDHDLRGFQRVMDGAMDIGCYEADWSGRFAGDIGRQRYVSVAGASSAVYEDAATKKVVVPSGSTLTVDVDLSGADARCSLQFVVASGTFYVSCNGGEPVAFTASQDVQGMTLSGSGVQRLTLTASADGSATLMSCRMVRGAIMIVL